MNFGQFLKFISAVSEHVPGVLLFISMLKNAEGWEAKLKVVGAMIDELLKNPIAAKAAYESCAFTAMSEEDEDKLAFEVCGLFRNRQPAGGAEADAFDGTKLKAIWTLLQPFLPLILKLIGVPGV
jgi:hypothetical protein